MVFQFSKSYLNLKKKTQTDPENLFNLNIMNDLRVS